MLTESFWDPVMQSFQWLRLNHLGLVLSKISAVGIVLRSGDSEYQRGLTKVPRLQKDLQDLLHLLRDEVATSITGWHGQIALQQLVSPLVTEIIEHIKTIDAIAKGTTTSSYLPKNCISQRAPRHHPTFRKIVSPS